MAKKREQTRADEERAWGLRSRGWTCVRIAEELGITPGAAWKMLNRVEKRVLERLQARVTQQKARQTAQLEHVLDEALQAWEKSKENAQTVTKRTLTTGAGEEAETEEVVTQTVKGQVGNPSFLAEARGALADLRKLWGLNEPEKLQHALETPGVLILGGVDLNGALGTPPPE